MIFLQHPLLLGRIKSIIMGKTCPNLLTQSARFRANLEAGLYLIQYITDLISKVV